jgi:hypothetical protein
LESAQLKNFLEDLQSQLALYKDMIGVNTRQSELLDHPAESDPDDLFNLVAQKQQLMSQLGDLESRLRPHKDQWNRIKLDLPDSVRTFADGLLEELASTIGVLIEMEDAAHKRLEEVMGATKEGINSIRKKAQVNRAYAAYGARSPGAKFVDHKGDE